MLTDPSVRPEVRETWAVGVELIELAEIRAH